MGERRYRWYVMTPEGTDSDWFATREKAEAHAVDVMTEELRDCGEGRDESCYVLRIVSRTEEVVGARSDDEGERAEWLRERGLDYEITGYRCAPIEDESGPPAADPVLLAAITAPCPMDEVGPLLAALRERYPNSPITLAYHPDADPGDGSGWAVEVGDRTLWGDLVEAMRGHLGAAGVSLG